MFCPEGNFTYNYTNVYTYLSAGVLLVWHLSHPRCEPGESINREYLTILSACGESSTMLAIYQVLVVICLPDAGLNLTTFARVSGPLAFHISTVIAYNHLKDKWSQSQAQEVRTVSICMRATVAFMFKEHTINVMLISL